MHICFSLQVVSVQDYGIFVKIPGSRKNGLVHKSQMSNVRIETPSEMASKGDSVYCKVISVEVGI
uniref:S1 motif domain-containing protein n=1 Tax=Capitella teleta TaxID=283909 RepID=X2BBV5_CAPTE